MFKKFIVLTLSTLVLNLFLSASVFAETKEDKALKRVEKVKANVTKLGTGKDALVEVKLSDGTKLKGYVSQISENNFVIVDDKTGSATEASYRQVKQIKGNNLSTGVKIAIGVGILLVLIVIISTVGRSS